MSIIKPVVIALLGVCFAAGSSFAREAKNSAKSTASSASAKKKKSTASSSKKSRSTSKPAKNRAAGLASKFHFAFAEELPPEDLPEVESPDEG